MKRYIAYALLIVNSVPVQADQSGWCSSIPGCEYIMNGIWGNVEQEKKRQEEEAKKRGIQRVELNNVPSSTDITTLAEKTSNSSTTMIAELTTKIEREDEAIAKLNERDAKTLIALLHACKDGVQEKCVEYKTLEKTIHERSVIAGDRAIKLGALKTNRVELVQSLEKSKKQIGDAYAELERLMEAEDKENVNFNEEMSKAKKACIAGNSCSNIIDAINQRRNEYTQKMQNDVRVQMSIRDTAYENFKRVQELLENFDDRTSIEQSFPAQYAVAELVPMEQSIKGGAVVLTSAATSTQKDNNDNNNGPQEAASDGKEKDQKTE